MSAAVFAWPSYADLWECDRHKSCGSTADDGAIATIDRRQPEGCRL